MFLISLLSLCLHTEQSCRVGEFIIYTVRRKKIYDDFTKIEYSIMELQKHKSSKPKLSQGEIDNSMV